MKQIRSDFIFFGYGGITDHLIKYLLGRGKSVICVTNQGSLSNADNLKFFSRQEIMEFKPVSDIAIFSWRDDSALNDDTSEWLSRNLRKTQKSFLLSSASVYMNSETLLNEQASNLDSDHLVNNKYILERKLHEIMRPTQTSHTNLRIANVYGRNLHHGFISSLLDSLKYKIPADVYIEKSITRDYVSVSDLCLAIERLTKIETNIQNLNISTGIGTDIEGVLKVFEDLGRKIHLQNYIEPPKDIKAKIVLDCGLLKNAIEWNPVQIKVGISQILS